MEMATIDELDARVRFWADEVEGEKAVTRHVLEQAIRNGDVLNAVRSETATLRLDLIALASRVDHVAGDVTVANAALRNHGNLLNVLRQDVTVLRQDTTALHRDVTVLRQDVAVLRQDTTALHTEIGRINHRLDTIERNIAAILAAVAPQRPPASSAGV